MANIQFLINLQKVDQNNKASIFMHITFNSERIRRSTSQKCLVTHWNEKTQRVKPNKKSEPENDYEVINTELDRLQRRAKDIINHALYTETTLTKSYFEKEWNSKYPRHSKHKSILDYFDMFIEIQKPLKAERTIKGHTTVKNFLNDYCDFNGVYPTLSEIDYDFFEDIREYSYSIKKYSDNTLDFVVKRIKIVLNWALKKGYHNSLKFKEFTTTVRPTEIICLYKDELFDLYDHEFENKRLERVRDVYCFGCFTGLRFSDIIDLKRENLKQGEIQKVIKKTKEFQRIPLNQFAREILKKYSDLATPIPKISEQKFNEYIKEACAEAGIDTPTTLTRYVGKDMIQEVLPKHKLITSHTARKTFTTNSLIFGMSESSVKKITGHKKDENFKKYVRLAESYIKEEMDQAWKR